MKPSVYIETTIVSYLTAWPSRDLVRLSHEALTRQWWNEQRRKFDLLISQAVLDEASAGDPLAAKERMRALEGIDLLPMNEQVIQVAGLIADELQLPQRARADAFHISFAACHGVRFVLTWNCRHLANAILAAKIESVCRNANVSAPRIVTPHQLMDVT